MRLHCKIGKHYYEFSTPCHTYKKRGSCPDCTYRAYVKRKRELRQEKKRLEVIKMAMKGKGKGGKGGKKVC